MRDEELLVLVDAVAPELFGRGQRDALEKLAARHEELLGLVTRAAAADPALAIRLAASLWRYWFLRGHLAVVVPVVAHAVERAGEERVAVRARGLVTLAVMNFFIGRHEEAGRHAEEFFALNAHADPETTAFAKTVVGWVAQGAGDWDAAAAAFEDSLRAFRLRGHRWGEALSLLNLGEVARSRGDIEAARRHYTADLEIYRELGEQSAIAATLGNLGFVALAEGKDPSAAFTEALDICLAIGNRQFIPGILVGFAAWYASAGEVTRAAELVGAADAFTESLGSAYEPADKVERDRVVTAVAGVLGAERAGAALAAGGRLSDDQVVASIRQPASGQRLC